MGYEVSDCIAGELLLDNDFTPPNGNWNVGVQWSIPGNGFAYFTGPSVVNSGINQTIEIVENHLLEIHFWLVGAFFSLAGKGLHLKIGGWTSPLITAQNPYVFYAMPTAFGSQLFEIVSDTPPYSPADFAIISYVSCQDTICNIVTDDFGVHPTDLYYNYWELANNRLMVNLASRFDKSNILLIHDPEFP